MNTLSQTIAAIDAVFASEMGPARAIDPKHCEECEEADRMLLDLDPRDLNFEDLSNPQVCWIFPFASKQSIGWLAPGFARVAMEQNPPQPDLFFDIVSLQESDVFTDEQWIAILDLADYCCEEGWVSRSELGFLGPGAFRGS